MWPQLNEWPHLHPDEWTGKPLHASTDVAGDKFYFKNKLIFLDSDSTLCDVVIHLNKVN